MTEDWRYSEEKLRVRQQAISTLLHVYGSELDRDRKSKYTCKSIYECAHDWVSQGNAATDGIVQYYRDYYYANNN